MIGNRNGRLSTLKRRGVWGGALFLTDKYGGIVLTKEMRDAVVKAERDFEEGRCLSEAEFKEKFAK